MKLIINSDDFGLSDSISDGIVEGILGGHITSTSIMANMPHAKYAIDKALENNIRCIGLHSNLTVGKPLLANPRLTDENGIFLYNRKQIENKNLTFQDAYNEIMAQVDKVKELSGGGISIDHLDTHHFLLENNNIKEAFLTIAKELNVPVRLKDIDPQKDVTSRGLKSTDVFEMGYSFGKINLQTLEEIVNKYKNQDVVVELLTHAGFVDDYTKTITSKLDRDVELETLKQAKRIGLFDDLELISFSEL